MADSKLFSTTVLLSKFLIILTDMYNPSMCGKSVEDSKSKYARSSQDSQQYQTLRLDFVRGSIASLQDWLPSKRLHDIMRLPDPWDDPYWCAGAYERRRDLGTGRGIELGAMMMKTLFLGSRIGGGPVGRAKWTVQRKA
jgi:hypothetical protein